jgi:hypothetical protein
MHADNDIIFDDGQMSDLIFRHQVANSFYRCAGQDRNHFFCHYLLNAGFLRVKACADNPPDDIPFGYQTYACSPIVSDHKAAYAFIVHHVGCRFYSHIAIYRYYFSSSLSSFAHVRFLQKQEYHPVSFFPAQFL